MNTEDKEKIKAILANKPARWMNMLLDMWAHPDMDMGEIGIRNGLKAKNAKTTAGKIVNDPIFLEAKKVLFDKKLDQDIDHAESMHGWWLRKMRKSIARFETAVDGEGLPLELKDSDGDPIGVMADATNFNKAMDMLAKAEQLYVVRKADGSPVIAYQQDF